MATALTSLFSWVTTPGVLSDPVRDSLQATEQGWFYWLLFSTAIVAVGVLFESPEATATLRRWFQVRRGEEVDLPNEGSWVTPFSYLGLLLVIAGVVGEGAFEALVSRSDTALRAHDTHILGEAQMRAGEAIAAAEHERLSRIQIEKSMQWRQLSQGARKSLCDILPPQSVSDETVVVTVWTDPEPALYATEFRDTIGSCHPLPGRPDIKQGPGLAMSSWTFPIKFGVWLEFPAKDARIAKSLGAALRANGVDVTVPSAKERQFPRTENRLIVVGPKAYPNDGLVNIKSAETGP